MSLPLSTATMLLSSSSSRIATRSMGITSYSLRHVHLSPYSTSTSTSSSPKTKKRSSKEINEEEEEEIISPFDQLFGNGKKESKDLSTTSTKSSNTTTTSSQQQPTEQQQQQQHQPIPVLPDRKLQLLNWNSYLQTRRQRRVAERTFGILTGFSSFSAGAYYFSFIKEFDPTKLVFGVMDPPIAYTLGAMGIGAVGAVIGFGVGRSVWNLWNRRILHEMDLRDKIFNVHLTNHRAPPTSHSVNDTIPDYYGEKIKDLQGFKSWIRKQRKHKKKVLGV